MDLFDEFHDIQYEVGGRKKRGSKGHVALTKFSTFVYYKTDLH